MAILRSSQTHHMPISLTTPPSLPLQLSCRCFPDGSGSIKFIMVGGVKSISELVDVEGRLMVENYTSSLGAWEPCPLLPVHSRSGKSSQWPHTAWYQ